MCISSEVYKDVHATFCLQEEIRRGREEGFLLEPHFQRRLFQAYRAGAIKVIVNEGEPEDIPVDEFVHPWAEVA